jgi:hypothetical protein
MKVGHFYTGGAGATAATGGHLYTALYNFNKFLSMEGGYTNLGTLKIETTTTGPIENFTADIEPDGYEFSVLGKLKIDDNSMMFVRVGLLSWDAKVTVTSSLGSASGPLVTGTDITLGIGYEFNSIRIEYQYYKLNDVHLNTLHASYVFSF